MIEEGELPELLARVEDAAGKAAMLEFAHAFGGTEIYLPQEARDGGRLARAVGMDAAVKIVAAIGHGKVEVPLGPLATHTRVRKQIRERLMRGESLNRVAKATGCHVKTVKRERRRLKETIEPPLLAIIGRR